MLIEHPAQGFISFYEKLESELYRTRVNKTLSKQVTAGV